MLTIKFNISWRNDFVENLVVDLVMVTALNLEKSNFFKVSANESMVLFSLP
jgi:hypothetical protein